MVFRNCVAAWFVMAVCQASAWAGAGVAPVFEAPTNCALQSPRFPRAYAKVRGLRNAPSRVREHSVPLTAKGKAGEPGGNLQVWVDVSEVDLDGDGTCDLIVTVFNPFNPLSADGDNDALTTDHDLPRATGQLEAHRRVHRGR